MNIQMRNYKLFTQMPGEPEHAVKFRCNQKCTLDEISNILQDVRTRTSIVEYSLYKGNIFREKHPFRVSKKDKPGYKMAEVTKKKNHCHNCGEEEHCVNNCPKEKAKVYAIQKASEEETQE
ncbi:hypothetical protein O181_039231 [Austropuccinia psidii MF-1]|uniref:CCHC-type domain-containing protein n=1 Tax=Austropuccinia psidii MF-1 TaxID=1389203 RepID=A0A9Q3D9C3_9BASI|nr:hypothetical protein [Austropuccinia psidii MF-1]